MEGLSPKVILLEESKKAQQFYVEKANDQFSIWVNFEETDSMYLRNERPRSNAFKHQISSNMTTKGLSPTNRRFFPSNWTYSLKNFTDLKFEHFLDSSCYIQQYRNAKRARIEEKLAGLKQSKEKRLTCGRGNSHADKNVQSSDVALMSGEQSNSCSKKEPMFSLKEDLCTRQSGVSVKPSLPQSGYFAGRKWIYPRDYSRGSSKNIGVKCGDSRMAQFKTENKQVNCISRNMFLRGTGKPLNISSNKNLILLRHRTMCRSAPARRQKHPENSQSGTTQAKPVKTPARSDSLTCADLSVLLERHSITQPQSSLQASPVQQSYAQVKRKKNPIDSKIDNNRLEYEKIFRNVFDFYE